MKDKRSSKKGMAKPAADVIRRGNGGRFVAATPTPVELRADREPAVVVKQVVKTDETVADTDVWAPPPVQLSWFERIVVAVQPKKSVPATGMAENLAAVKAGVMQEFENIGVKKGVAIKSSPFSGIMLPTTPRRRKGGYWGYVAAAALVIVGMMVWIGSRTDEPVDTLGAVMTAVRKNDVRTFDAKVDVASVASSIVNQMFGAPTSPSVDPMARMAAFVKPGLADNLKDEMLAVVAGEEVLDDSGNTLLGKLWHAMGAEKLRVGAARIAAQDETTAVAEVPLMRADLGLNLPLQVRLDKAPSGWEVIDVPNIAAVLGSIAQAEMAQEERRQLAVMEAAATRGAVNVRVESIRKAKPPVPAASNLMVTMVLVNDGPGTVHNLPVDVAFGDAAGQPMMSTQLVLDGELPAGARREQVWSVPVDRTKAVQRYVADLPLTALTVTATIVR